jgi:L-fucose isomerase-like protein
MKVMKNAKKLEAKKRAFYLSEIKRLHSSFIIEDTEDDALINVLALRDQILEESEKNNVDAVAVQDFMSIVEETGAWCYLATSFIAEKYPYGLESDVHGAISNLILKKALFDTAPPFLVDITARHPKNDNGVLMWHAGAPLSMCHPDEKIKLGKHWILKSPYGGMGHFRLKDGAVTMARFDGEAGEYKLAVGEGQSIKGPHTLNNYVWIEVDDWSRWERTLMEGPFPHHTGMIYGNCLDALVEACKYIPGLSPVKL